MTFEVTAEVIICTDIEADSETQAAKDIYNILGEIDTIIHINSLNIKPKEPTFIQCKQCGCEDFHIEQPRKIICSQCLTNQDEIS